MARLTALWFLVLIGACDVFRGGAERPQTALSEREFVSVYVALGQAHTPEAKAEVLRKHGTSEEEMEAFLAAYADNLPALSEVFDSIVARQGAAAAPALP